MMTPPIATSTTTPRLRALRIATLGVAPLLAALAVTSPDRRMLHHATPVLIILWTVMAASVVMRLDLDRRPRRAADDAPAPPRSSIWAQLDVLTATGSTTVWMGTAALLGAGITGWASLSVVGVLGLGAVYLAATWTVLVAGGDLPWRRASIARAIVPELATEGDELREEVRITGVRIPAGMRLFATGRATRYGAVTRYAVDASGSLAELKLESQLGPALRGEHHAPPLALWLGDVLGLTRTQVVHRAPASFTVLPRPAVVRGVKPLLGLGGDDAASRPTQRRPTEGSFRIREYVPGDDARRIHWVRTLQMNQLVVRLPDEIPPASPEVRVILDSDLWGTGTLSCRAPDELLDALVRVWLGVARALTELGTRVTLVATAEQNGSTAVIERRMAARSPDGQRLGGRVAWQTSLPLTAMIEPGAARQIVVSSRPRRLQLPAEISWIVVPEMAWTSPEPWLPLRRTLSLTLPFPSGSAENRAARRNREHRRIAQMWHDRTIFSQVTCWTDWTTFSGDYVARPRDGHVALAVIL